MTVEVDFKQPFAAFPELVPRQLVHLHDGAVDAHAKDKGSSHPVGTGPFVFSSWEPNNNFTVNRNPHYWGGLDAAGKVQTGHAVPELDRVPGDHRRQHPQAEALQSGDIDMLTTISASTANSLAGNFNEVKDWDGNSVFVQFNTLAKVNGQTEPVRQHPRPPRRRLRHRRARPSPTRPARA